MRVSICPSCSVKILQQILSMHPISTPSVAELLSFLFLVPEAVSDSEPQSAQVQQGNWTRVRLTLAGRHDWWRRRRRTFKVVPTRLSVARGGIMIRTATPTEPYPRQYLERVE
ncbi:hypothetical protein FJTKL_02564 [Diaporthe vaccinii]|uniref:Uncharacterized protein n=1 Tax=Diaporthe vaccinii TaxID=105482 RepID=A0ABR4DXX0_9PEZI